MNIERGPIIGEAETPKETETPKLDVEKLRGLRAEAVERREQYIGQHRAEQVEALSREVEKTIANLQNILEECARRGADKCDVLAVSYPGSLGDYQETGEDAQQKRLEYLGKSFPVCMKLVRVLEEKGLKVDLSINPEGNNLCIGVKF